MHDHDDILEIAHEVMRERFPEAAAIIVAGSIIRQEHTATSDLDLVVLYDRIPQAYSESFFHGALPVRAFINDLETLTYFIFEVDRPRAIPALANMIHEGTVIPAPCEISARAKRVAQEAIDLGPPEWRLDQIEESRYAITGLLDDIHSPRSRAEMMASGALLLRRLAEFYLRTRGEWSARDKWIPRRLEQVDPTFAAAFNGAFDELFSNADAEPAIALASTELDKHGGPLFAGHQRQAPNTWRRVLSKPRISRELPALPKAPRDVVVLTDASPSWNQRFEDEARAIRAVLPIDIEARIEHIGSTAVESLESRPIIDIMLLFEETTRLGDLRAPLESLGYYLSRQRYGPGHMLFIKGLPPFGAQRSHHVHVRHPRDVIARRKLLLRDLLRSNNALSSDYAQLKHDLAVQHAEDLSGYLDGKSQFIGAALFRHLIGANFPVLTTIRLNLVQLNHDHTDRYAELFQDRSTYRYISDRGAIPAAEIPAKIEATLAGFEKGTGIYWALEHGGLFVGYVAIHQPGSREPVMSYALSKEARKQGLMTESLQCVIDFVRDHLLACDFIAHIHHRNKRSARLLDALGFVEGEPVATPRGARREFRYDMQPSLAPPEQQQLLVDAEEDEQLPLVATS